MDNPDWIEWRDLHFPDGVVILEELIDVPPEFSSLLDDDVATGLLRFPE